MNKLDISRAVPADRWRSAISLTAVASVNPGRSQIKPLTVTV